MNSVIRYINILELLPIEPKQGVTTKDILEKLEKKGTPLTLRTLQRDLVDLIKHYPITCNNRVRPHRWRFSSDYQGSFAAMDVSSAVSTILVNEYLLGIMPAPLLTQLSPQLNRAKSFLQSYSDKTYTNWLEKVKIIPDGKILMPASVDPKIWTIVCDAIMSNKALDVAYDSHKKDGTQTFTLHPYGLMIRKSATFVLGSYNDYQDVRQYALHRFKSLKLSLTDFRPNSSFSIQKYIDNGEQSLKYSDQSIHLEALISKGLARRLEETKLSDSQLILKTSSVEWLFLRAVIPDDWDTYCWLRSQGSEIIVREPSSLKQDLLQEAATLIGLSERLQMLEVEMS
jgi:predicted DNA-binding transcriptional regulator YafY